MKVILPDTMSCCLWVYVRPHPSKRRRLKILAGSFVIWSKAQDHCRVQGHQWSGLLELSLIYLRSLSWTIWVFSYLTTVTTNALKTIQSNTNVIYNGKICCDITKISNYQIFSAISYNAFIVWGLWACQNDKYLRPLLRRFTGVCTYITVCKRGSIAVNCFPIVVKLIPL